jgi:uncharacterized glyoxalase superfamily protein PhnB
MEPESFFHVAVKVRELDPAIDFYREQFDAEVLERGRAEEGDGPTAVDHAALEVADKRLYLFDRAPYEAAGLVEELPTGFLHFGYVVEDVWSAWEEVTDAGVEVVMEPSTFGDLEIAFFVAPGDVRIELIEYLNEDES